MFAEEDDGPGFEFGGGGGGHSVFNPFGEGSPHNNSYDMFNNAPNTQIRARDGPGMGPVRTAGQITLKDIMGDDKSLEPFMGRDATILIEGEMRQFD
jgi:hypothetical protein